QKRELLRVAFGLVYPIKSVSLSLFQTLLGSTARIRNSIIIDGPRLIDRGLLLLLRLVYFVKSRLDRRRRTHGSKLDLLDLKAEFVVGAKLGQAFERSGFNVVAPNRKDFIDGAITDHFAHHAL